jgi:murein DD-endopeptidase MepM/ murein hydrolase activator NlpD
VVAVGDDIYLLDVQSMWCVPGARKRWTNGKPLFAFSVGPAAPKVGSIPVQEFSTFAQVPARQSIAVLDKSGDIFEYSPAKMTWSVLRPNHPFGSPDPEYLDMAASESGKNVVLLDPERNQIWRFPATNQRYFKEVLPWRLRHGDISVADGVAIANDGFTWVVRRTGNISKFQAAGDAGMAHQIPFHWQGVKGIRPSRMATGKDMPLYVVERENNRVIAVDKQTGKARQFLFAGTSNLRGLFPEKDGFWIIDHDKLVHRTSASALARNAEPATRQIDERLSGLRLPIKGSHLPGHPGVWAGARRLYRHGIHKGTDFFHDPGRGTIVSMGTPVYAADAGKVIRSDQNFQDMNAAVYSRVIGECHSTHQSSEKNEDLLRGCQVWIDHGNGLITKYAHLDKAKPGLKTGTKVSGGDLIGFVGVSGTGENLPGRGKHPHLHFEVWLDGKYVGNGLTPSETIGVYEDIFGR